MPPVVVGVAAYVAAGAAGYAAAAAIAIGVGAAALTYAATPSMPGTGYANDAYAQQQMIRSPAEPRRSIYGRAQVSGPLVFISESGQDRKYLHLVIPLAGHRCDAIERVYFGDEVAMDGLVVADKYAGKARVKVYLGNQVAADPDLVAECAEWTSAHVGYGVTYLYVRLEHDTELFPNGVPNIKALVRGKRIYDPRLDDTAGGLGPHRWDDETTWQWSQNWGLCLLDFTRYESGVGALADEIDLASFATAANDSDQQVPTEGGNTEPRYSCNGTWPADQSPSSVLEQMLTAGAGTHVYVYGQYRLYAGVYQGPPAITLTEDDAAGQIEVRPTTPRADLCNAVRGTFVDPAQGYQATDFPPLESAEFQAEDNGEYIDHDLDLPFTQSVWAAQRIAKLYLLEKRSGMQVSMPVKMIGLSVSVGRVVTLDLPRINLNGNFRVVDWQFEYGKPVSVVLQYHTAELYDQAETGGTALAPASPVNYPDPSKVPTPSNLAFADYGPDASLQGMLSWDAPGGSNAYRFRVEVSSGPLLAYQANPTGTSLPLPRLDAGNYLVRVWALNLFGNKSNLPAELALAVDTAPPVTAIDVTASLFELAIYPRTSVATATSTQFEVLGGDTNDRQAAENLGTGKNLVWTKRRAGATYYLWARTVNDYGLSAWFGPVQVATSTDSAALVEALQGQLGSDALDANTKATLDRIKQAATAEEVGRLRNAVDDAREQLLLAHGGIAAQEQLSVELMAKSAKAESSLVEMKQVADDQAQAVLELQTKQDSTETRVTELVRTDLTSAERAALLQVQQDDALAEVLLAEAASADTVRRMASLRVRVGKAESSLTQVQEVTAEQAQDLLNLQSQQGDNATAITQLNQTQANQAQSLTQITATVNGQQVNIDSLLGVFEDVDGNLVARGGWVSDSDGLLNGVLGYNNGQISQLDILANVFRLVVKRSNGTIFEGLKVNLTDPANPVMEFAGKITAGSSIESPVVTGGTLSGTLLKGGRLELVGSAYMEVLSGTPFGPDNLLHWYGPRSGNVDAGGNPVLTSLTKAKAVSCRDNAGSEKIGGTLDVNQITGNVTNIQRVNAPSGGYWYKETITNSNAVPYRKVLTLTLPAVGHNRYVSLMNLMLGINNSNTVLGTSFGGWVQARLADGTVLQTWGIALDGSSGGGDYQQAGSLVTLGTGTMVRQLRDLYLPKNQSQIQFWITIDTPAGSGVTSYDIVASCGAPGFTSARVYGQYVDVTSILAGSESGVTLA
ncbi:hypothetical protein PVT67_11620 [Gallaecimonas kandeliae]|uniref:phage tail tip protein J-related protein n=1 Tax=Gallaecimonas kandeliae TaxID=3029055 RepID=UPI0026476B0A|nr:hypothetical protein [Gallaecimonas kandeliae]WKE64328.1 hypothetical protein PVT67_11620 [Gallaecimonas kandeliae]